MRSTSGTHISLAGGNTRAALNARSRKQTAVSHSTPEAEIVAVDDAVRNEGLPAVTLWQIVLEREVDLRLQEDNDACAAIIRSGRCPAIRYLNRTHKIDIAFLSECHERKLFVIDRCPSNQMEADIMTNPVVKNDYWVRARLNISQAFPTEVKWVQGGNASGRCYRHEAL